MAISPTPQLSTTACLVFLLIFTSTADAINTTAAANDEINRATTSQELETTLEALRIRGYTLFTNAIATSDLQFQLLSATSAANPYPFTVFAPKDVQLFALDMESDAAAYVSTLRYHVIPNRRLTFSDLLNLSFPFVDTFLPQHSVLIGKTQYDSVFSTNVSIGVLVDGVRVSEPDLFLGSRFVVHGIDGILVTGLNEYKDFNVHNESVTVSPPAPPPSKFHGNISEVPSEENFTHISESDRKNPVVNPPALLADNMKSLGNKKRGKRQGNGRRHRRHGHRLDHDL